MDFIFDHSGEIAGILLLLMSVAQAVVNLTPTPKDNELVGKIYPWIERLAGIWGDTAKEHPGERGEKDAAKIEAIVQERLAAERSAEAS